MNTWNCRQQRKPLVSLFEMISKQHTLFEELSETTSAPKPVNVASVPQRSPFRYPGGKTWFVPTLRRWLRSLDYKPEVMVEPFAGGGIISLTSLFEDLVSRSVMVELDDEIAAVWQSVVGGHTQWLAKRILEFDLTRESVIEEISKTASCVRQKAFQTVLKNRTLHGGILAKGSGFVKHGESGKGIRSRWYPETLARRFCNLRSVADRIDFRQDDGLLVIAEYASCKEAVFFIDPPYTAGGKKAGRRLYRHCDLDHEKLFSSCNTIQGDFLMTYDNADEVKDMARNHGFQMRLIPMNNTHHAIMEELVIGKDLSWMDQYPSVREPEAKYRIKRTKKTAKSSAPRTASRSVRDEP
jgi:DNA adenine methylase